jgi:hypothetical protein
MPGEVRLEPIVALTDAPTADENQAIGSGLARFNEQPSGLRTRTTRDRLLRGAIGFAVFLGGCATANTPQQDLAYERWGKCNAPYVQLQWIDLDGRITFRYSTEGGRQDVLRCLADAGRGGPPLPEAVGMRPPSGP